MCQGHAWQLLSQALLFPILISIIHLTVYCVCILFSVLYLLWQLNMMTMTMTRQIGCWKVTARVTCQRVYNYDTISSHLIPWGSIECLFLSNYCSYRSEIFRAVFSTNDPTVCKISITLISHFSTLLKFAYIRNLSIARGILNHFSWNFIKGMKISSKVWKLAQNMTLKKKQIDSFIIHCETSI